MKKRLYIISITMILFLLFTGGVFKEVKIMTQNSKPLINLDDYIHSTSRRDDGSEDSGDSTKENDSKQTDKKKSESENNIIIEIEEKTISMNGKSYNYESNYKSAENFESDLSRFEDYKFEIKNEKAESHAFKYVYNSVREIADDNNIVCKPYGGK